MGYSDMKHTKLEDRSKEELLDILDALEIDGFNKRNSVEAMTEAIKASENYVVGTKKTTEREHKTLGKYIRVEVHALDGIDDIYVGLGLYSAEIISGEPIELPEKVIDFLETSGVSEHYWDAKAITVNGNVGEHKHRIKPNYIIKKL